MTASSSTARDEIMSGLTRGLADPAIQFRGPAPPLPAVPMSVTEAAGESRALAAMFGKRLEEVQATCEMVDGAADVPDRIVERIGLWKNATDGGAAKVEEVLSWAPAELPLPDLEPRLRASGINIFAPGDLHDSEARARAAKLEVGITGVDAAFASTGSVVMASSPGRSRAASLLPLHHLMLVPTSRLYPTFEDWLQSLRGTDRLVDLVRESAQLAFITGPSKSADIELILTLGVHGPKVVHAIVFDDSV